MRHSSHASPTVRKDRIRFPTNDSDPYFITKLRSVVSDGANFRSEAQKILYPGSFNMSIAPDLFNNNRTLSTELSKIYALNEGQILKLRDSFFYLEALNSELFSTRGGSTRKYGGVSFYENGFEDCATKFLKKEGYDLHEHDGFEYFAKELRPSNVESEETEIPPSPPSPLSPPSPPLPPSAPLFSKLVFLKLAFKISTRNLRQKVVLTKETSGTKRTRPELKEEAALGLEGRKMVLAQDYLRAALEEERVASEEMKDEALRVALEKKEAAALVLKEKLVRAAAAAAVAATAEAAATVAAEKIIDKALEAGEAAARALAERDANAKRVRVAEEEIKGLKEETTTKVRALEEELLKARAAAAAADENKKNLNKDLRETKKEAAFRVAEALEARAAAEALLGERAAEAEAAALRALAERDAEAERVRALEEELSEERAAAEALKEALLEARELEEALKEALLRERAEAAEAAEAALRALAERNAEETEKFRAGGPEVETSNKHEVKEAAGEEGNKLLALGKEILRKRREDQALTPQDRTPLDALMGITIQLAQHSSDTRKGITPLNAFKVVTIHRLAPNRSDKQEGKGR